MYYFGSQGLGKLLEGDQLEERPGSRNWLRGKARNGAQMGWDPEGTCSSGQLMGLGSAVWEVINGFSTA